VAQQDQGAITLQLSNSQGKTRVRKTRFRKAQHRALATPVPSELVP
jgi:hypothetical protein